MGSQWGRDKVYLRAVREGYRSRAALKLHEIQDRFSLIRNDDNVIDLGAAPGSWLQVVRSLTTGHVIGIDLSQIPPIEGIVAITGDFTDREVQNEVRSLIPYASVVLSDASPKLSGQRSYDQARAIALGEEALLFATRILKPGGNCVIKSFQGEEFGSLVSLARQHFFSVKTFICRSSRRGSTEIYLIGRNYKGRTEDALGPL
jgi:23S rRNA (uridine2552-2'-O)-methyltransferase